jgi:hypothetical protein
MHSLSSRKCIFATIAARRSPATRLLGGRNNNRVLLLGIFACMMTTPSLYLILYNVTNLEMRQAESLVYFVVRIPIATPQSDTYSTIIYPLLGSNNLLGDQKQPNSLLSQANEQNECLLFCRHDVRKDHGMLT